MRLKRWLVIVLMLVVAVGIMPTRAADPAWTAWLYESAAGQMTKIDDSGALLSQFLLPAAAGSTYGSRVAISADGLLLAYSTTSPAATSVNVYDLTTFSTVYSLALSPSVTTSLDFSANAFNFSDGNSTFAFSYTEMGSTAGWQIVVVDLVTFSTFGLNEADAPAGSISSPGFGFLLPVVTYNRDQQIKFMMIPLGTDGAPSYVAYTWNIASNSISPNAAYITPDTDTFDSTGEVISTLSDPRFPESADPTTGFPNSNTLQVFDPLTNERFIVTSLPRIYNPRFIQGGERVAVLHYENTPDNSFSQTLQVVERTGAVTGIVNNAPLDNITTMQGTINGFVFAASNSGDSGTTTLYYVETRFASAPFNAVPLWASLPGANTQLVWLGNAMPSASSTFNGWGRLAPSASAVPTTPPIAPPASSVLTIGGQATVQTTEGEVLNLRSGPARSFDRLGTVNNGTVVTLLEGPTSADGLFWWRVRLPTGVEGWLVDAADGIQTLVAR